MPDGAKTDEVVVVVTAIELDDMEKQRLGKRLTKLLGDGITSVRYEVNPGIVGGIIVRRGGKLIDGSIRTRLESLRRELAGS